MNSKHIIGYDIETAGTKQEFVLGCLVTNTKTYTFTSKEEVRNYFLSKYWKNKILVCTNVDFDIRLSFSNDDLKKFNIIEEDGRIYGFIVYIKDGEFTREATDNKLTIYDTGNYMKASVERLGKIVGLRKMKQPRCFLRRPKNDSEFYELESYCINDALISKKFMELLQEGLVKEGGQLKMTSASTSMYLFRSKFQKMNLVKPNDEWIDFMLESYYGGRTEVFRRGRFKKKLYYQDYNSLYPSIMLEPLPHPNYLRESFASILKIMNYEGVSEVEVTCPEDLKIPYLPFKHIVNDVPVKLVFPKGTWKGTYTHFELRNAIKLGYKVKPIGKCLYSKKTYPFLKEYAQYMYKRRLEYKKEGSPMQEFYKLLMNSLYGKFGQKPRSNKKWVHINEVKINDLNKCDVKEVGEGWLILDDNKKTTPLFSQPLWASYITAMARSKLYFDMYDKNPIYCDTDSIITEEPLKTNQTKLGALGLEYTIDEAVFIKPKLYWFKGVDDKDKKVSILKAKGVQQDCSDEELLKKILTGQELEQKQFVKIRTSLRSKEHHKFGKLSPHQVIIRKKVLDLEDTKRKWENKFNPDTNENSSPIDIEDLQKD